MDFTIFDSHQTETRYSGEDSYRFDAHGLLIVTSGGRETTYAPHAWEKLEQSSTSNSAYIY